MADIPTNPFILSGVTSTRLRAYCTSQVWQPTDLDEYAALLQTGSISAVQTDWKSRVAAGDAESARNELSQIAYGPTKVPLFNYLLQLTVLKPARRSEYVSIVRYLALEAKVPVDSYDLSGTTTFMYAISTKPYWDSEIGNIMIEAGANVNHQNRYGCTAGHEIAMARDYSPKGKKMTTDALRFFIEKGGDINIADGDRVTARQIAETVLHHLPELKPLLTGAQISGSGSVTRTCAACSKEESGRDTRLKSCAKCHTTLYCSRECQKNDWKKHKKVCARQAASATSFKVPTGTSRPPGPSNTARRQPMKNLKTAVDKPFHRLEANTWLHDRAEQDVYKLVIDTYRFRMEDEYIFEGHADSSSVYGGAKNGIMGFRRFLRLAESREGILPSWWSPEKAVECEAVGMNDDNGWSSLAVAVEKRDLVEHYQDSSMPMQLRMLGEQVYGRGPGGLNGTMMRRQMMLAENNELGDGLMSILSL